MPYHAGLGWAGTDGIHFLLSHTDLNCAGEQGVGVYWHGGSTKSIKWCITP